MAKTSTKVYKILVVGIIILFIGMSISPSVAIDNVKKPSIPISSGNTLYVGGTGEGNYTKIQDAIDNATDGDTLFVYNESSPYYENVIVNKSINLIGVNWENTVIDSNENGTVIKISANQVNLSGFTLKNCGDEYGDVGILIKTNNNNISCNNISSNQRTGINLLGSNHNIITDNIISNNGGSSISLEGSYNNTITSNIIISNNGSGLRILESSGNNISYNTISNNERDGIFLCDYWYNRNNIITHNIISNNENGIDIRGSANNTIEFNNICNNEYGVYLIDNLENFIIKNNFIKNKKQVYCFPSVRDELDSNFYDNWIGARIKLPIFQRFPKIMISFNVFLFPVIIIDLHPAKEPYDI